MRSVCRLPPSQPPHTLSRDPSLDPSHTSDRPDTGPPPHDTQLHTYPLDFNPHAPPISLIHVICVIICHRVIACDPSHVTRLKYYIPPSAFFPRTRKEKYRLSSITYDICVETQRTAETNHADMLPSGPARLTLSPFCML